MNAPTVIQFVDIDSEGLDMAILENWPWDVYDVELFCIEFSVGKDRLINFMSSKGYIEKYITGGNLLFAKAS